MIGLHLFDNSTERRRLAPGEVVFEQGDAAAEMFAVVDGAIDVVRDGDLVYTAAAGDVVGEMAIIDAAPRTATARARTESTVVPVDQERFLFLVHEHPTFALQVMSAMANKLR